MKVKSAPGTQCPMEGKPKIYITDNQAVQVPDTAYYQRLVDDGSLIEEPVATKAPKSKEGGDQ